MEQIRKAVTDAVASVTNIPAKFLDTDGLLSADFLLRDRDNLLFGDRRRDGHLDSLHFVAVVSELEERFDVSIEDDEMEGLKTVGDVVALLQCRIKWGGTPDGMPMFVGDPERAEIS